MSYRNERNSFNPRLEHALMGCIYAYGLVKDSIEKGNEDDLNNIVRLVLEKSEASKTLKENLDKVIYNIGSDLKERVVVGLKLGLLDQVETFYYFLQYVTKDIKELEGELLKLGTLKSNVNETLFEGYYKNLGLLVSNLLDVKQAKSCLTIDEESLFSHFEFINNSNGAYLESIKDLDATKQWLLETLDVLNNKKVNYIDKKDVKDYDVSFFNMIEIYNHIGLKVRSHFYDDILKLVEIVNKKIVLLVTSNYLYSGEYKDKEKLLKLNIIESVIKLPANNFSSSFNLIVINKEKRSETIKFLDATNMSMNLRKYTELKVEEILKSLNDENLFKEVPVSYILTQYKENLDLTVDNYKYYGEINLKDEVKLEDVTYDIFRGIELRAKKLDELKPTGNDETLCKMVVVKNLTDDMLDLNKCEDIKYSPSLDRYLLKDGDILLSSRFSTLKISKVNLKKDELAIATDSVIVIRANENVMLPEFLFSFLKSETGFKVLDSVTAKRTINIITISALKSMPVIGINIDEQKEFSVLLSEINEHIKLMETEIEKLKVKAKFISNRYFK